MYEKEGTPLQVVSHVQFKEKKSIRLQGKATCNLEGAQAELLKVWVLRNVKTEKARYSNISATCNVNQQEQGVSIMHYLTKCAKHL